MGRGPFGRRKHRSAQPVRPHACRIIPKAAEGFMTVPRRSIIRTVIQAGRAKHMAKTRLRLVAPATVKRTVTPKRRPNSDLRTREHLTEAEVERLMEATKRNRYGHRDSTMILVAYRHGLRVSELVDLRWEQADLRTTTLHVRRSRRVLPARSDPRGRVTRPEAAPARTGAGVVLRVHRLSAARRLPPQASRAWWNELAGRPSWLSSRIPTCCVTLAAMRWRTEGMIRGRFRLISGIGTSSTQCATVSCRQHDLRISGGSETV
jgi:integrase